jgi:hypothetical protein
LGKVRVPSAPSLVSSQAASPSFSTILASKPSSPGRSPGKLEIIEKYREAARQKAIVATNGKARLDSLDRQTTFEETPAPAIVAEPLSRPADQKRFAEQSRLDKIRSSPKYTQGRQVKDAFETNPTFMEQETAWHKHAARWDAHTLKDRRGQQAAASPDDSARHRSASQPPSPASSSSRCGTAPPTSGRPPAASGSGPSAEKSWPSNGCGKMCSRTPVSGLVGQVFGQAPAGVRPERVMPGTLDPGIGDVATAGVTTVDLHSGTGIGRRNISGFSGGGRSPDNEEQPNKLWGSKSKRCVDRPSANGWEGMQLSARGDPGSLIGADDPDAIWSARAGSSRGLSTRGKRCHSANAVETTSERLCFSEPVSPREDCSSMSGFRSPRLELSSAAKLIRGESDDMVPRGNYEALEAWSSGAAGSLTWAEKTSGQRPPGKLTGKTFSPNRVTAGGSPDAIGSCENERARLGNIFQDYAGHGTWDISARSEAEGKHILHTMDDRIHGSGRSPGPLPRGLATDSASMGKARVPVPSCEDVCRGAAQAAALPAQGRPTGAGEEVGGGVRVFKGGYASSVPLAGCADAGAADAQEFFSRYQPGPEGHAGSRSWQQAPQMKGRPELSPRCTARKVTSVIPTEQWLSQDPGTFTGTRKRATPKQPNDSKRFAAVLSARECPSDRPEDAGAAFESAYGCPSTHEPPRGKAMPQSPGESSHPFVYAAVARDEPPQFVCRRSPEPSSASFADAAGLRRYSSCEPRARRPAPFGSDAD